MIFVYDDGGRKAAGYKGHTGDCVTRSIAIATGIPYQQVYDAINEWSQLERNSRKRRGKSSARTGVYKATYQKYLRSLGWTFTPTMGFGTGCRVHLTDGELPDGRLIVSVSKHLTCVIDGVIYDTHDPQRAPQPIIDVGNGTVLGMTGGRCVYGYWRKT